jgi:hypothetical protein
MCRPILGGCDGIAGALLEAVLANFEINKSH